jgi:hypothetical protein
VKRQVFILILLAAAFVVPGCNGHIGSYALVEPAGCKGAVYETRNIRIEMSIVDDRLYGLKLANKTGSALRILWNNSTAINPQGREVGLGAVLVGGDGKRDISGVLLVKSGEYAYAQAYPLENAYNGENGGKEHYPLYTVGGNGKLSDLEGRPIGINLVLDINNRTRLIPLILKVEPSSM